MSIAVKTICASGTKSMVNFEKDSDLGYPVILESLGLHKNTPFRKKTATEISVAVEGS
jgi:hypothetical protein